MPPRARPIDTDRALALYNQEMTWQEVADALGVKRTTLLSRLRSLGPLPQRTEEPTPEAPTARTPEVHTSVPMSAEFCTPQVNMSGQEDVMSSYLASAPGVHPSTPEDRLTELRTSMDWWREHHGALEAVLSWWRGRQDALQATGEESKTERVTYHVQHQWIEAVKRQADLERRSITEVINGILRDHFTQK